jgi:uncharacterized protein
MTKLDELNNLIIEYGSLVVAFSGGVDSGFLAHVATRCLGKDKVTCVTAVSPTLAEGDLVECESLAAQLDLNWISVETKEFSDMRYLKNDNDRCFWCKQYLLDALEPIAETFDSLIALGVQIDDLGQSDRPGQNAAQARGAVFPLAVAGLTKSDIRSYARQMGLEIWNKPANACLASRIARGNPIDVNLIRRVSRMEAKLKSLGFSNVRARTNNEDLRIECSGDDMPQIIKARHEILDFAAGLGYRNITLDLKERPEL